MLHKKIVSLKKSVLAKAKQNQKEAWMQKEKAHTLAIKVFDTSYFIQ